MKLLILITVGCLYCCQVALSQDTTAKKLVCYYNALNQTNQVNADYLDRRFLRALTNCTHLMYSYAQIQPWTFEIGKIHLNPKPLELKQRFPHLKIFLSVGGDKPELTAQYLKFLESGKLKQKQFTKSIRKFLRSNYFNGLDLAFPLPRNKPRKVHSGLGMMVNKVKNLFTSEKVIDANASLHKQQYTNFVNALKAAFIKDNLQLSMTVLPNVNSSWYFDILQIHKNFEFINLFAFDFLTPTRNPKDADYTAPIYFKEGGNRLPYYNIEYQVNHWIYNGCPVNKLNLGIATYGQAWKLTANSGLSGRPVVESTDGPAEKGKFTQMPGILSWSEICLKLATKGHLRKVVDEEHKYGTYAFRPGDQNNNGIWISFDDPKFAVIKAKYVKQRGMGGVALYDLQHDDFRQLCMGPALPILSSVSQSLGIVPKYGKNYLSYPYDQMKPKYALRKKILK